MILRKPTGFTPIDDTYIRLDEPIGSQKRTRAIREGIFYRIFIEDNLADVRKNMQCVIATIKKNL